MICQACKKEFDEYESPICEDCLRKIWHKSNETPTNEWATKFSRQRPPSIGQQKHLANLYRGFHWDHNVNYSTHKDFPGHEIIQKSGECSCGENCDASSKFKQFLEILPNNGFRTSPIIFVLKGVRDEYNWKVDPSEIPIKQIKALWDPRHPPKNKTNEPEETNSFFARLRRRRGWTSGDCEQCGHPQTAHKGNNVCDVEGCDCKSIGSNQIYEEWPTPLHYTRSIAKQVNAFETKRFKNAEFEWKMKNVRLRSNSGQFTFVLPCEIEGEKKVIRLFTEKKPNITERYEQLSQFFQENSIIEKIPELVDFDFYKDELNVQTKSDSGAISRKYDLIEMDRVLGDPLDEFISKNFQNSSKLLDIADQFSEFVEKLESNKIGHGDLHPKNIIIDSDQKMKLIDYDCFYIPPFKGDESPESGQSDFQHPSRSKKGSNFPKYDETIDRFSSIVIYLSLLIISKEPKIYDEKYSENILFSEEIFDSLREGEVPNLIENIKIISDEKIKNLMKYLLEYIKSDSPQIKALSEIIKNVR